MKAKPLHPQFAHHKGTVKLEETVSGKGEKKKEEKKKKITFY